jgi:hypothetical protein
MDGDDDDDDDDDADNDDTSSFWSNRVAADKEIRPIVGCRWRRTSRCGNNREYGAHSGAIKRPSKALSDIIDGFFISFMVLPFAFPY